MQGFINRRNVTFWQVLWGFGAVVAFRFLFGRRKTFLDCFSKAESAAPGKKGG